MKRLKEIFEFLKPNCWNMVLTLILVLMIYVGWDSLLRGTTFLNTLRIPAEGLTASGNKILARLIASAVSGLIVITYTLISLIVYFARGDYKDEK
jgi:hypothetical protein